MTDEETVTDTESPAIVENLEENKETETKEVDVKEETAEPKEKKPWFQKRIDRFHAQNQALARTNEQLMQELANLKSGKTEEGEKSSLSQAEIDALVTQKANEIIAAREFNDRCNAVYEDGNEEYQDFPQAVKSLGDMGMLTKPFLELVTDLDESHKVLYHLGNNPEEADRIQSLSPAKQALALAKLEASLNKPKEKKAPVKQVSKAPEPIKPVQANSGKNSAGWATKYYDGMPQDEFEAWDDKQSRKRG